MTKHIVLISSGQPSLNPRLVKEADALSDAGYHVTVLYVYWNDWGTRFDVELLKEKKWAAKRIGGSPQNNSLVYNLSRIINKISRLLTHRRLAPYAISRATWLLKRAAAKQPAHLYIAHNLAALPAAVVAAKKNNALCGFDAEDFHRNETSDDPLNADVIRKTTIENKYLPMVNQFTASSQLIANAYLQLFPKLTPVVIHNVLPNAGIIVKNVSDKQPLKLFWFSQTIGPARGIEDVIEALTKLKKDDFELHLLGYRAALNSQFLEKLSSAAVNIKFHDPIAPDKIISFAAQFDIGLALEPAFSKNNDIALSNKIFTYLQAGLAIVSSRTAAQAAFMDHNPEVGHSYAIGNAAELSQILATYKLQPEKLTACKKASLALARNQYNWELESQRFLALIEQTLNEN